MMLAGNADAGTLHADRAGGREGAVGVRRARIVLGDLEQRAIEREVAVQELVLGASLEALVRSPAEAAASPVVEVSCSSDGLNEVLYEK